MAVGSRRNECPPFFFLGIFEGDTSRTCHSFFFFTILFPGFYYFYGGKKKEKVDKEVAFFFYVTRFASQKPYTTLLISIHAPGCLVIFFSVLPFSVPIFTFLNLLVTSAASFFYYQAHS